MVDCGGAAALPDAEAGLEWNGGGRTTKEQIPRYRSSGG